MTRGQIHIQWPTHLIRMAHGAVVDHVRYGLEIFNGQPTRRTRAFVHVLLFRCPRCGLPLTATSVSDNLDREHVAIRGFRRECQCGWSGEFVGLTAIHHWVEPWEQVSGTTG
jgi:hypothetical protein